MIRGAALGVLSAAATGAAAAVWFADRAPYPYARHRVLDLPLPLLTPRRLLRALDPRPGQRLLEIGPGTGLFTAAVAARLWPGGHLDVVDVQAEMLDHTLRRLGHPPDVTAHLADASDLPFPDASVDGVFMVTVLGETDRPRRVLGEVARVLRPGGRLVVGEFADRHHITLTRLVRDANAAGLHLLDRCGPPLDWFATLERCPRPPAV